MIKTINNKWTQLTEEDQSHTKRIYIFENFSFNAHENNKLNQFGQNIWKASNIACSRKEFRSFTVYDKLQDIYIQACQSLYCANTLLFYL